MSTSDRKLPPTDPDLIRRAIAGDREAWDALFAAAREKLAARIDARLGPALRGKVEVCDILQETCLLAYRSRGRFEWRGEAHFLGWLATLAGYVIRGTARRECDQPGTIATLDDVMLADLDADPPSRGLRREERFERLLRAYEKLSPDHRKVLRLVRLEGLPELWQSSAGELRRLRPEHLSPLASCASTDALLAGELDRELEGDGLPPFANTWSGSHPRAPAR